VVISAASVLLVALNIHQFAIVGWTKLVWISAAAIPLMALACGAMSRRRICRLIDKNNSQTKSGV
jgi:hypothetical protein